MVINLYGVEYVIYDENITLGIISTDKCIIINFVSTKKYNNRYHAFAMHQWLLSEACVIVQYVRCHSSYVLKTIKELP